jgi:type III restriction enzyme
MYAFVINNVKRLRDDMVEAMAAEFKFTKEGKKVVEREFRIPHEYLCAYSASARNQADSEKNVYDGYPLSAMTSKTRSKGEAKFEKWCESADCVEWVYRNGDKGDEFFSIVYEDNSGHQRLFYPDYILRMDGETWIIEIKGGWTASGASGNIDEYAAKKADVLAAYCRKHGLRGGFICHDESEDVLLISEDGYSDDVKAACWHELEG